MTECFNAVDGLPFTLIVDVAHNPAGIHGLVVVAGRIGVRRSTSTGCATSTTMHQKISAIPQCKTG